MKNYITIQGSLLRVKATPMDQRTADCLFGNRWINRKANRPGYFIKHLSGFTEWLPSKWFDKHYGEVKRINLYRGHTPEGCRLY